MTAETVMAANDYCGDLRSPLQNWPMSIAP